MPKASETKKASTGSQSKKESTIGQRKEEKVAEKKSTLREKIEKARKIRAQKSKEIDRDLLFEVLTLVLDSSDAEIMEFLADSTISKGNTELVMSTMRIIKANKLARDEQAREFWDIANDVTEFAYKMELDKISLDHDPADVSVIMMSK